MVLKQFGILFLLLLFYPICSNAQDDKIYGLELLKLGQKYAQEDNYGQAYSHLVVAWPIIEREFGKEHNYYHEVILDLCGSCISTENYSLAKTCAQELVNYYQIEQEKTGKDNSEMINIFKQLIEDISELCIWLKDPSLLENQIENYSLEDMEREIQEAENKYTKNHFMYVEILNSAALKYYTLHDNKEIYRSLLIEALTLEEELGGKKTATYFDKLRRLTLLIDNPYEKIDKLYELVLLSIRQFGLISEETYIIDYNMGVQYLEIGRPFLASIYFESAFDVIKKLMIETLYLITENERNKLFNKYNHTLEVMKINAIVYNNESRFRSLLYDMELFYKAILLNIKGQMQDAIYSSEDKILIQNWQQFIGLQNSENPVSYLEMESNINLISQKYRNQSENKNLSVETIRKELKENEAAIEIMDISSEYLNDEPYIPRYFFLLLKTTKKHPGIFYLSNENDVYNFPNNYDYSNNSFYDDFWKNFEKSLKGITDIYISPNDIFHFFPFSRIQREDGSFLLDHYNFHNVLSTRDIIRIKDKLNTEALLSSSSIALFGGADFGIPYNELSPPDVKRNQNFDFLPGSLKEVNSIHKKLSEMNFSSYLYIDKQATESQFKSLSSHESNNWKLSPDIIHLSTHGFYIPPAENSNDNPLMRSGLLLSGANEAWSNKPILNNADDGILTAQEIAQMNLHNTRLVVLSACATGLGDLVQGEGIFGLQRAFKLAGVQSILISIDDISDQNTVEFMVTFYTFLSQNHSIYNAFIQTQRHIRSQYPNEPERWASFLLIE